MRAPYFVRSEDMERLKNVVLNSKKNQTGEEEETFVYQSSENHMGLMLQTIMKTLNDSANNKCAEK